MEIFIVLFIFVTTSICFILYFYLLSISCTHDDSARATIAPKMKSNFIFPNHNLLATIIRDII